MCLFACMWARARSRLVDVYLIRFECAAAAALSWKIVSYTFKCYTHRQAHNVHQQTATARFFFLFLLLLRHQSIIMSCIIISEWPINFIAQLCYRCLLFMDYLTLLPVSHPLFAPIKLTSCRVNYGFWWTIVKQSSFQFDGIIHTVIAVILAIQNVEWKKSNYMLSISCMKLTRTMANGTKEMH